jgi:hypothetical protein
MNLLNVRWTVVLLIWECREADTLLCNRKCQKLDTFEFRVKQGDNIEMVFRELVF